MEMLKNCDAIFVAYDLITSLARAWTKISVEDPYLIRVMFLKALFSKKNNIFEDPLSKMIIFWKTLFRGG